MPTEMNAAVRLTDYSTSGTVTTWKTGLNFQPHEDVLFRGTLSRDIRAPSRRELFATALFAGNTVIDRFRGDEISTANTATLGNITLLPEVADSVGFGVVYTSSWLDGFSASVDYYKIDIEDSIGSVNAQDTMDRCFYNNEAEFCNALSRNAAGALTRVNIKPVNFIIETNSGIDIEATYRIDAGDLVSGWRGDMELRALATHYLEASTEAGNGRPKVDAVGSNGSGPPDWKYSVTGTYRLDNMRVSLTGRGLSSGVNDTTYIECTSGCPLSTVFNRTIDNNHMDGAIYFDLSLSYQLNGMFSSEIESELFLVVQNLGDKDPPVYARFGGNPTDVASNPFYYDILGRELRFGIRTQF